ncbi:MAG: hypothetical protein M1833_003459 [Piccolia ochrophora]|nr:MAG: hypothetical protein M1833_003459 [Piccolia ochrophora]
MESPTRILPIDPTKLGEFSFTTADTQFPDEWQISFRNDTEDASRLREAAESLRSSDIPVAFPTETVYGLGADATRSAAVKGIYKAKRRPVDNPLIVHVCSLTQLRNLLRPASSTTSAPNDPISPDPIPSIYHPLIRRFWPGPLTILLPLPTPSPFAPEVTAGLATFGVRIPANLLALALIHTTGVPLAAPSANASTKPSPTTAEHVATDLAGRIDLILDGGPCAVGVESTVVDGLSDPPTVLRPGGVGVDQLRQCEGWEGVVVAYKDDVEMGNAPRAPGMKYRHYSPRAPVVLYEVGSPMPERAEITAYKNVGVIRTRHWPEDLGLLSPSAPSTTPQTAARPLTAAVTTNAEPPQHHPTPLSTLLHALTYPPTPPPSLHTIPSSSSPPPASPSTTTMYTISLTSSTPTIARGLFSALRDLDASGVEVIFVEGIDVGEDVDTGGRDGGRGGDGDGDGDGDGAQAAAVMNRLRKAAGRVVR